MISGKLSPTVHSLPNPIRWQYEIMFELGSPPRPEELQLLHGKQQKVMGRDLIDRLARVVANACDSNSAPEALAAAAQEASDCLVTLLKVRDQVIRLPWLEEELSPSPCSDGPHW